MHRHITYYTQSTVSYGGFSNKFLSSSSWAYAGFAKGGVTIFFWGGGACNAWRSQAFPRGVRGHASLKKIFEWCNKFGAFWSIFS